MSKEEEPGMIERCVERIVRNIAEDEVRTEIKKQVSNKISERISDVPEIAHGIIIECFNEKLRPVKDEIEKIDIQPLIDKVKGMSIGDGVGERVEALESSLDEKIAGMVKAVDTLTLNVEDLKDSLNSTLKYTFNEILDDLEEGDDIFDAIKDIALKSVSNIKI